MTEGLPFGARARGGDGEIIGRSPSLKRALALADRFAATPLPILLIGATGTGKELFAHRIHARSGRRGSLVPVNCAALPRDMVESLLFGHARGAFTGAVKDRIGFVEAAERGTLYLDELPSLPLDAQGALLRVLESKDVYRLGETRPRRVDFRLVASGPDDLTASVGAGTFRGDLLQRVVGVRLELTPLLERREDVIPLAEHFAGLHGQVLGPGCALALTNYPWPGNVRELRAAVERAAVLSENGVIPAASLTEALALGAPCGGPAAPSDRAVDRKDLLAVCAACGYDARRIAAALGWGLSTIYRRLQNAGISLHHERAFSLFSENSRET